MHTRLDTVVIPSPDLTLREDELPGSRRRLLSRAVAEADAAGARRAVVVGPNMPVFDTGGMEVVRVAASEGSSPGAALSAARTHVGPGPIGIILPDHVIEGGCCLGEMSEAYMRVGAGHLAGVKPVSCKATALYGIVDPLTTIGMGPVLRTVGIVEKPGPANAPSRLAVVGRYILHPRILSDLSARRDRCLTGAISDGIGRVGLMAFRIEAPHRDAALRDQPKPAVYGSAATALLPAAE